MSVAAGLDVHAGASTTEENPYIIPWANCTTIEIRRILSQGVRVEVNIFSQAFEVYMSFDSRVPLISLITALSTSNAAPVPSDLKFS